MDSLNQNEKIIWSVWQSKSAREVVREAASKGTHVNLAHRYLMHKHGWDRGTAEDWFRAEIFAWVLQLLFSKLFFKASDVLKKMQICPEQHFLSLATETSEIVLRDYIVDQLLKIKSEFKNTEKWGEFHKHFRLVKALLTSFESSGVFKQNMVFGSGKDIEVVTESEVKSLTISQILGYAMQRKVKIAAYLFFETFDFTLLEFLNPLYVWNHLLETNKAMILVRWINMYFSEVVRDVNARFTFFNNENFVDKLITVDTVSLNHTTLTKLDEYFRKWSIDSQMIDNVSLRDCFQYTRLCVYDALCSYGIVVSDEKKQLRKIICRLARTHNLKRIDDIFSEPCSTMTKQDFYLEIVRYCMKHKLYQILTTCIDSNALDTDLGEVNMEDDTKHCIQLWLQFKSIEKASCELSHYVYPIYKTCERISNFNVEDFISQNPVLALGMIILDENFKLFDIFNKEKTLLFTKFNLKLNKSLETKLPHLKEVYDKFYNREFYVKNDVNVYQLLSGYRGLDVSKIFEFQFSNNTIQEVTDKVEACSFSNVLPDETKVKNSHYQSGHEIPHFASAKLSKRYGYVSKLNYMYYLKQNRPCMASQAFVTQQYQHFNRVNDKSIKDACCEAHALALQNWNNPVISACCISFITMIGCNPARCRTHLTAANTVKTYLIEFEAMSEDTAVGNVNEMMIQLSHNNSTVCTQLMEYLEIATQCNIARKTSIANTEESDISTVIFEWQTAIKFALLHSLPLPEYQLKEFVKRNLWFSFLVFGDIFRYPQHQMLSLSYGFTFKPFAEHLKHIIMHRTIEELTAQEKDSTKQSKEGQRKSSRINSTDCSPTHNMSFDFPEIVSCSSDLWEVMSACHGPEDPPGALIRASEVLRSPLLALVATCYEPNAVGVCWAYWIISTLGELIPEELRSACQWDISEQCPGQEQFQQLMEVCLKQGYVRTLHESMLIFFPDSPLSILTAFLCRTVWQLLMDAESVRLLHQVRASCARRPGSTASAPWLQRPAALRACAARLLQQALCHCFSSLLHQRDFLNCLCELGSFGKEFSESFLDFQDLYDLLCISMEANLELDLSKVLQSDPAEYLQHCVDVLVFEQNFVAALNFAKASSVCSDDILLAEWTHKYEMLEYELTDEKEICKFVAECSEAFRKAAITPKAAVAFLSKYTKDILGYYNKFYVYRIILSWYNNNATDCSSENKEEIEHKMWESYFASDNPEEIILCNSDTTLLYLLNGQKDLHRFTKKENLTSDKPFCSLLRDLETAADTGGVAQVRKITGAQAAKWRRALERLVQSRLLVEAFRLCALFCVDTTSTTSPSVCPLLIVRTCLRLAEGYISPYDLPQELHLIISSPSLRSRLSESQLSDVSFEELVMIPEKQDEATEESCQLAAREDADRLAALDALAARAGGVTRQVASYYRVSLQVGWSYVNVLHFQGNPLELVSYVSGRARMSLANLIFKTYNVPSKQIAEFLSLEMVAAIVSPHLTKSSFRQKEHFRYTLWGFPLDADIEMFLNLRPDACSLIGRMLLDHLMAFRRIYKGHIPVTQENSDELDDSPLDLNTIIDEEYQNVEEEEIESLMSESAYTVSGVTASSLETPSMLSEAGTIVYSYTSKDVKESRRNVFDVISNTNVRIPFEVKTNVRKITKGAKLTTKQVNVISMELLIVSHECFSCACDTEGIAVILRSAQALCGQLLAARSWRLLVRLLTGLARYTEMAYVFQELRNRHQFEFLLGQFHYMLGQQQDKIIEFKQGLLDFLKNHCPEDTYTYYLVALRFNMYEEAAAVKKKETDDLIVSLEQMALDSMKALSRKVSRQPEWLLVPDNANTRLLLEAALQSCEDAAELCLRGGRLGAAGELAGLAQRVALQLALLRGRENVRCILNLSLAKVYTLVGTYLSFMEGLVLAQSMEVGCGGGGAVRWRDAVYQRCLQADPQDAQFVRDVAAYRVDVAHQILQRYSTEKNTQLQSNAAMNLLKTLIK